MKASEWQTKKTIEANYQKSLQNLIGNFFVKLPHLNIVMPEDIMREFKDYCRNGNFAAYINSAVSRMVTGLHIQSAKTWRQAARESMQGRRVYTMLRNELSGPTGAKVQEIISRNSLLIQSLPNDVSLDVTRYIAQQAEQGYRSKEIQSELRFMPSIESVRERVKELNEARIALIARTETSKASTALTRARSDDLGLDWYIWRTSKDTRVRESHRHMDRVLINWNDPPSPETLAGIKSHLGYYHAGDAPNDRCYPEPILDINRISWPAKVHVSGRILTLTLSKFVQLTQPARLAA